MRKRTASNSDEKSKRPFKVKIRCPNCRKTFNAQGINQHILVQHKGSHILTGVQIQEALIRAKAQAARKLAWKNRPLRVPDLTMRPKKRVEGPSSEALLRSERVKTAEAIVDAATRKIVLNSDIRGHSAPPSNIRYATKRSRRP